MRLTRFIVVALIGVGLVAAACGGGGSDGDDGDVTAESVLSAAGAQWAATDTVHFALTVDGDSFIDSSGAIKLLSAEGDLKRPDAVKADAKIDVSVMSANISMIAIGSQTWMTNVITGSWEKAPEDFNYNPSILFDANDGIEPILGKLQNTTLGKTWTINDRNSREVDGTVSEDAVARVTSGAIQGDEIDIRLWVDTETNDLLRIELKEPSDARENPVTWTLDLTKQGDDVTIEAPTS
ncbi:MAG: LppX_LprAFG lipoprotein [Thermomicrobiales bacterium]|nr:LppX_LprAFG lipoprotein [Thermomicrobiales bacterium]